MPTETSIGDVYIVDSGLGMILIFNKELLPIAVIDKTRGLKSPISVAVDNKGMIYVSEHTSDKGKKGRLAVFDPTGHKRETIEFEGFPGAESFMARDIAIDEKGNLYLGGGSSGPLIILSGKGKFIRSIQPREKTKEGKEIKADVIRVVLKGRLIYLLSQGQGRIYVYNHQGDKVKVFGEKGGSPGKLSRAQGLSVDASKGVSYVIDYMRHTLLLYDSLGVFINEFGGKGRGKGWFYYPKDICMDGQGRLFVADTFNHRVQVFQMR